MIFSALRQALLGIVRSPDASMDETSATSTRDWRSIALAGGVGFAASFVLYHFVLPVGAWVAAAPGMLTSAVFAALTAALAMLLATAFFTQRLRINNRRMQVALNNMSQGLCMFDRNERLVICNRRYAELYNLPADVVSPGTSLIELLEYRAKHGSFSRELDEYRVEFLASMARAADASTEVKSADGRTILVTNRPMADGGWVATHEDITERRDAEHERASMQEQQQRRTMIEQAIAAFRQRVEDHLRTVAEGAMAMRATATHAVRQFRPDLEKRRERGRGLQRSLRQCRDRRGRRRRIDRLDRRDRPPAHA